MVVIKALINITALPVYCSRAIKAAGLSCLSRDYKPSAGELNPKCSPWA